MSRTGHACRTQLRRAGTFLRRVVRTGRTLATDRRLPRWLRVLFAVGCIQIPVLPFDEIALVLAVSILLVRHRPILREAWQRSAASRRAGDTVNPPAEEVVPMSA